MRSRRRDPAHGRRQETARSFLPRERRWGVHGRRRCALRCGRPAQGAEHRPGGRHVYIAEFLSPHPHFSITDPGGKTPPKGMERQGRERRAYICSTMKKATNDGDGDNWEAHLLLKESARICSGRHRRAGRFRRWCGRERLCGGGDTTNVCRRHKIAITGCGGVSGPAVRAVIGTVDPRRDQARCRGGVRDHCALCGGR